MTKRVVRKIIYNDHLEHLLAIGSTLEKFDLIVDISFVGTDGNRVEVAIWT